MRCVPLTFLAVLLAAGVGGADPGAPSNPQHFALFHDRAFFAAYTDTDGESLWTTEGTAPGTQLIKGFGKEADAPANLTAVGESLFFSVAIPDRGYPPSKIDQLWISDGTPGGTALVTSFQSGFVIEKFHELNGRLIFRVDEGGDFARLWSSDGTAAGTVQLPPANVSYADDIVSTDYGAFYASPLWSAYGAIAQHQEIWKTDGTPGGTYRITSFYGSTGPGGSIPIELLGAVGGQVIFRDRQSIGALDPRSGTVHLIKDVSQDLRDSYSYEDSTSVHAGGILYFTFPYDSGLWRTDGTTEGTWLLARAWIPRLPRSPLPHDLYYLGWVGEQFFCCHVMIARTRGEERTPLILRSDLVGDEDEELALAGNRIVFTAGTSQSSLTLLWTTDGTSTGTIALTPYGPHELFPFRDLVLFSADDGVHGRELWRTDGTLAGTSLVANINPEGSITGTVIDADTEKPLAGVAVCANNCSNPTGADGRFSLEGLAPGKYALSTQSAIGYLDQVYGGEPCGAYCDPYRGKRVEVTGTEIISGIVIRLSHGARISGVVRDALTAAPIASVAVTIRDMNGVENARATTDSEGRYVSGRGLLAGRYFAQTNSLEYTNVAWDGLQCFTRCVFPIAKPIDVAAGTIVTGIDFSLPRRGHVTGRLIDADTGFPITCPPYTYRPCASVTATSQDFEFDGTWWPTSGASYSLSVPPGTYTISAVLADGSVYRLVRSAVGIAVGAGETKTVDLSVLRNTPFVEGTIVDLETHLPVAGMHVALADEKGGFQYFATSDDKGKFFFLHAPKPGTYYVLTQLSAGHLAVAYPQVLCATRCDLTGATPIVIDATSTIRGIDFQVPKAGSLHGFVREAVSKTPLGGVGLNIEGGGITFRVFTNAAGLYSADTMQPGSYTVTVALSLDRRYLSPPPAKAEVPGGTDAALDIDVHSTPIISGRVTDAVTGFPIIATIEITGAAAFRTTTDGSGRFTYVALPRGEYRVSASAPGYVQESYPQPVDIDVDAPAAGLNFVLYTNSHRRAVAPH